VEAHTGWMSMWGNAILILLKPSILEKFWCNTEQTWQIGQKAHNHEKTKYEKERLHTHIP